MYRPIILLMAVLVGSGTAAYGQDNPVQKSTRTPIEMKQVGTDKNPAQDYYHDGTKLENLEQLKAVIAPLNDAGANRLLAASADKDSAGTAAQVVGGLACAAGLVYAVAAAPTSQSSTYSAPFGGTETNTSVHPADPAPAYILVGSGIAVILGGWVLKEDGGKCRQDAVQRYNQVVKPEPNLSMILMPDTRTPALEWTQRF